MPVDHDAGVGDHRVSVDSFSNDVRPVEHPGGRVVRQRDRVIRGTERQELTRGSRSRVDLIEVSHACIRHDVEVGDIRQRTC